ncbi:MAG: diaminopimelate epimerase [Deltaproteobacteria bacterium]|nr:diaminopimelate epimerase [Deltaproteobacteria bacterium]
MKFGKYHGLGNDFLVVDLRAAPADVAAAWQSPVHAIALCDRQFGVGGDGVLAALPPVTPGAHARMLVLNSDGSEAEMCGNGLRCFVRALCMHRGLDLRELVIDTNAGPLACTVEGDTISVLLGPPRQRRGDIPMTGAADDTCIDQPYVLPGEPRRRMTGVATGNPHAVTFVDSAAEATRLARAIGPAMERHPWFPLKTNVEFAHVRSRRAIDVAVWERGCGLTLACGTGASATAVAAVLTGRADAGSPIELHLPGGTLEVTVLEGLANVLMRGPAVHVFDGEVDPRLLFARPR